MECPEPPLLTPAAPDDGFSMTSVVREGTAHERRLHRHTFGQLIYPERGAMLLETPGTVVRLAPDRAAWIPPQLPHAVLMDRAFRYHSLYVDQRFRYLSALSIVAVGPLLRELILDTSTWVDRALPFPHRYRKARVLLDELNFAPLSSSEIRIPEDKRITKICKMIELDPADNRPLEAWSRETGASSKTVQRAFVSSTGQTFQQWRHFVRMTRALGLHAQNMRLLDIAVAVGYATEGAYAQAFKKFHGHPPSHLGARPANQEWTESSS
jgi:AraC-like DNA-binding protein